MKVCLTGASGLLGKELTSVAASQGIEVIPLVRSKSQEGIFWDPVQGEIDSDSMNGCDAIIHLAGENISTGRWNDSKKQKIRSSRVDGTKLIASTAAKLQSQPSTLISASAIGFYGNRGDDIMTEESSVGSGFLADVCHDWELANKDAWEAGVRVAQMRIGVILSTKGGALHKMLPPFKMGVGGKIGSGAQYMSWIAIDDVVGAILHVLNNSSVHGAVNTVAPNPVTNLQFTKSLGRAIKRPTIFPMPAFAAKLVFGEMANDLLLSSTRVVPERLKQSGYEFQFPELDSAFSHLLS